MYLKQVFASFIFILAANGSPTCNTTAGYVLDLISNSCKKESYRNLSDCDEVRIDSYSGYPYCAKCSLSYGTFSDDQSKCFPCDLGLASDSPCSACSLDSKYNAFCAACKSGYILKNNQCSECSDAIEGCMDCNNSDVCKKCYSGFYLSKAGSCINCSSTNGGITNCDYCSLNASSVTCSVCKNGYYPNSLGDTCLAMPSNCDIADDYGKCRNCSWWGSPYYLSSGACIAYPSHCYHVDNNTGECTGCEMDYYVVSGSCQMNPSNCENMNSSSGKCTKCAYGYFLSSGSCEVCTTYSVHCQTCNDTTCKTCVSGYHVDLGSCASCPSNCMACENNDSCQYCFSGYYQSSGSCQPCSSNCLVCDSSSSCTTCSVGYYVDSSGACVSYPTNCETIDKATGKCRSCTSGYTVISGVCESYPANCKAVDSQTRICTNCNSGYYLSSGVCKACIAGCTKCSKKDTCDECSSSYYTVRDIEENTTCTSACSNDTQIDISYSIYKICLTCRFRFKNCETCNSSRCFSCSSFSNTQIYQLGNGGECSFCNGTNESVNKSSGQCSLFPTANVSISLHDHIPTLSIQCGVSSYIYLVFGLAQYLNASSVPLSAIQNITGFNQSKIIATNDTTKTWIGYGSFYTTYETKPNYFDLKTILKNSGEKYCIITYCVSLSEIQSNATGFWIQPSNNGMTNLVSVTSKTSLTLPQKTILGIALRDNFKIKRDLYDEEQNFIPYSWTSRLLDDSVTNTNVSKISRFYFAPDYRLSVDNINTVISDHLADSTTFLSNLNDILNGTFIILNVSVSICNNTNLISCEKTEESGKNSEKGKNSINNFLIFGISTLLIAFLG